MTAKRSTRQQLEQQVADVIGRLTIMQGQRDEAIKDGQHLRTRLDDVKERLAFAEADNQRMRGYLERVQEDDVVREELVTTGEPGGEQRMVPKRKPTIFAPQQMYSSPKGGGEMAYLDGNGRAVERRRHWVVY